MRTRRVGEWFAWLFVVAVVYVLVRPQSNAAQFVQVLGKFGRKLVSTATDIAK